MVLSVLIVSPSNSIRKMLARYLSINDFQIYTAESVELALKFIHSLTFDAVIMDIDLQAASGLDLLLWLNQKHPHVHPVMMCDTNDSDLMDILRRLQVSILEKDKLNLPRFRNLLQIACQSKRGVSFQFQQIHLFELIQLASQDGQTRNVYISSLQSGQEGLICFGGHRLKHALYDIHKGTDAFSEIVKLKQGLFQETELISEDYYTLDSDLNQLIANNNLNFEHSLQDAQATHCTIFSPDMVLAEFLLEHYPQADMEVICTDMQEEVSEQLKQRSDLLILDLDTPDLDVFAFLNTLKEKNWGTRIILIASQVDAELHHYLKIPYVHRFFLKPFQFQELGELIHQTYLSQQFEGDLLNLSLFHVLQTLSYFRQPRLLEVTDFFMGETGQIFFANGNVQHATFGEHTGRDALKSMLGIQYGVFRQETYWEPSYHSLNVPFGRLVLYLTRFIESHKQAGPLPRDLLLQNGELITLQPEKINYLFALSHSKEASRSR